MIPGTPSNILQGFFITVGCGASSLSSQGRVVTSIARYFFRPLASGQLQTATPGHYLVCKAGTCSDMHGVSPANFHRMLRLLQRTVSEGMVCAQGYVYKRVGGTAFCSLSLFLLSPLLPFSCSLSKPPLIPLALDLFPSLTLYHSFSVSSNTLLGCLSALCLILFDEHAFPVLPTGWRPAGMMRSATGCRTDFAPL